MASKRRTKLMMLAMAAIGTVTLLMALDVIAMSGGGSGGEDRPFTNRPMRPTPLDYSQNTLQTDSSEARLDTFPIVEDTSELAFQSDQLTSSSSSDNYGSEISEVLDLSNPQEAPSRGGGRYHNPYPPLNRSASRPCSGLSYTSGRWVKRENMVPRYKSYGEILGCCQRGYEEDHGVGAQRPETKYVWESDSCDLHEWDEELFCKALRGRNIMIAGDSLNDHWHASLYYLLGGNKDIYRKEGTTRGKRACATHPICGKYYSKPLKLYFLTNQLLEEQRRLNRNYKWWKHIHQYPILILNAGSWMRDPADETREVSDEEYFKHMEKALAIVKRQNFTGTLIWRTTYQGHPYCWKYTEPLTEELKAEDFPRVPPYLRYRWWAIPHRNNYTVHMWRAAGAHILDVRRITNLMPLGHLGKYHPKYKERNVTDCLHYCSPGPVYDTWSTLLLNLLAGNLDGV